MQISRPISARRIAWHGERPSTQCWDKTAAALLDWQIKIGRGFTVESFIGA